MTGSGKRNFRIFRVAYLVVIFASVCTGATFLRGGYACIQLGRSYVVAQTEAGQFFVVLVRGLPERHYAAKVVTIGVAAPWNAAPAIGSPSTDWMFPYGEAPWIEFATGQCMNIYTGRLVPQHFVALHLPYWPAVLCGLVIAAFAKLTGRIAARDVRGFPILVQPGKEQIARQGE